MPRIEPLPWEALSPALKARYDHTIQHGGSPPDKTASRILAYAEHTHVPDDGDRHINFPRHLLPGKLLEMLRIRSAQLGGCEPCMNARKIDDVTEDVVACMIDPHLRGDLSQRERLALEFLQRLSGDHHSIGDEFYCTLAQHFTTAEIIELESTCGHMIGTHRFIHTLDPYGDAPPVIPFDPAQVGVSWADLHGKPADGRKA